MFAGKELAAYAVRMPSYGENAALLRGDRKQEEISTAARWKRPSFVTVLEGYRGTKIPTPKTIKRHAQALGVEPWQLLEGVETEIDQLRKPSDLLRHGDRIQSPAGSDYGKTGDSSIGTEPALGRGIPSGKAPNDVEARLREEIAQLRAHLEAVAKAVVSYGAAEAPTAHKVAVRKSRRRRGSRKRA